MSSNHGGHRHGLGGHHELSPDADRRYLWIALVLLLTFMAGEVVVAIGSGSLALLSDAAHMLSDAAAVGAALWAMRLAARPARGPWTFGWKRAEILSAAGNGLTLLIVAAALVVEAIRRLIDPPEVAGLAVVVVALAGVVVNLAATWVLARANRTSLNVEGAYRHIVTDLYAFIGTAIAGVVILATGWVRADAVASLVVAGLMIHAGWGLVRDSGRVLLEAAPADIDLREVRAHLLAGAHVREVHDLHVWTVTSGLPALSVHLVLDDECFTDGHAPTILAGLQNCLGDHFDVAHSTFQLEPASHAAHESASH